MIKSNQGGRSSPDIGRQARPRHLAVVQAGDTAATVERGRVTARLTPTAEQTVPAQWLETQPDLFVPAVAEFLLEFGRSPEALDVSPDLRAEIAAAMDLRLSPGPRLSLAAEPEAEAEL
jgi:antitoxin (DNA-binding transcriptional repressor) of toxin-antitoxin stability system